MGEGTKFVFQLLEHATEPLQVSIGVGKVTGAAHAFEFEGFFDDIVGSEVGDGAFQRVGSALEELGVPLGDGFFDVADVVGIVSQEDLHEFGEKGLIVPYPGECRFAVKKLCRHGVRL
jgi:hypothetical protein